MGNEIAAVAVIALLIVVAYVVNRLLDAAIKKHKDAQAQVVA